MLFTFFPPGWGAVEVAGLDCIFEFGGLCLLLSLVFGWVVGACVPGCAFEFLESAFKTLKGPCAQILYTLA